MATIVAATSAGRVARDVDQLRAGQLAHPRELALGVVAGAALHRLDVAGEQLLEAERLAGGLATRPSACARRTSSIAPAATIASTRSVDALVEGVAVHRQADEPRRVAGLAASRAGSGSGSGGSSSPRSSSSRKRMMRERSRGSTLLGRPRARAGAARRGAPPAPAPPSLLPAVAQLLRRRGPEVELGQRGAQVQARAADDDRRRALAEQAVDLRVGEARVLAGAEARVDGEERDEPVLERALLLAAVATPVSVSSPR